ncbi:MAG: NAD+ synthase [Microcoleus sp. PH2017_10_PVI_O_A]|uniref:NAD+ synthase n=1 Tax=unclassified Microcoleus TaxID=2642155 RepID=UPI001D897E74|nr:MULTISPECIES: NAD+ synthase [unclassified Microcoleus]TAE80846.1 MAG: NAD+ synthase [Oscillatoriales cyanobacterium]MCC3407401.1 NAD+ synthase [Microcoleus sp. PH2017_10_PVI_O_A]MCC3461460.1 NAD+ synthase [Microcoleus sp. PH2017_11_PCY_U_A]MCC3479934.1 NAD+ synthase [Microcoleus sp. PH2017_12_PCY_D_A]MCC3528590.1 NAD+ synthase [Microcoleus sp. PH2017_21_RUC_O_A]
MKIAIAQLNPTIGDICGNSNLILEAAKQAQIEGANLLLTPELSLLGYPPRDLLMDASFIAAASAQLQQLARALPPELAVIVGTPILNIEGVKLGGKSLFNSAVLLQNGAVQQVFHKRLLPTYDVFDEDRYFEPGKSSRYFTIGELKIGVTICEDLWNNEEFWGKRSYAGDPISDLAKLGVDLVVNLSASPYSVGKRGVRSAMLQHSVIRSGIPIVYANQVGGNDDIIFDGSSFAVNRQGNLIQVLASFETDFAVLEYDENKQDLLGGGNRQDARSTSDLISTTDLSFEPPFGDAEIWAALVLGVRDYVRKCGFSKVVLGLSGGIDSALVAAIASCAIGPENVLGVLMPSPYSSDHSVNDALELARNLGIAIELLPIGDLMKTYDRTLADLFLNTTFGIAEENIQSRIRGNLLMAISNKFGHLLLSTGNKSEMSVGYCTLYGDMNGGLAVISDVPKTRVYSLCRWLNAGGYVGAVPPSSDREIIPVNIINKAPSAELKPGQVDQDSLPAYDVLDDILQRLIENHESVQQIIAAGHDAAVVKPVVKLVRQSEFKRRQAAPGLKISDRAFGTGWRMPIAKSSSYETHH